LGALLLMIPIAFVVGLPLTGHTPTWGFLQNPVVLLGSLGVAALGNLWSLVHAEVLKGKPPTLRIDIAANLLSIIVLAVAGLLGALLIGYAFVETSRGDRLMNAKRAVAAAQLLPHVPGHPLHGARCRAAGVRHCNTNRRIPLAGS